MLTTPYPHDAPPRLTVVIEVPRGSFIKRDPEGHFDFLSPAPSPFNYGSVLGTGFPGLVPDDGDPLDALVLGPRRRRGVELELRVWGWVDFLDAGEADPKLVCARIPPSRVDWLRVTTFFRVYARAKGMLQRVRGRSGSTRLRGITRYTFADERG